MRKQAKPSMHTIFKGAKKPQIVEPGLGRPEVTLGETKEWLSSWN